MELGRLELTQALNLLDSTNFRHRPSTWYTSGLESGCFHGRKFHLLHFSRNQYLLKLKWNISENAWKKMHPSTMCKTHLKWPPRYQRRPQQSAEVQEIRSDRFSCHAVPSFLDLLLHFTGDGS